MMGDESTQDSQQQNDNQETAGQGAAGPAPDITGNQSDESTPDNDADKGSESEGDGTDWKAEADKWKNLARKHQERSKGADKLQTEVETLREQVANHDVETVQAASTLATERLATKLARAGVAEEDTGALIEHIDPMKLLADGEPSSQAIDQVASSLARSMTRSTVDSDQGQRSPTPAFSADDWLRRKARS